MKNNDKPRKCTMLTLLMLTALSMNALPQGAGKLSTWLQRVVMTQQESHMRRGEDQQKSYIRRGEDQQDDPLTTVFVQLTETATDEVLATYDCKKYAQLDDISIVTLPLSKVGALSELKEVKRIEASETCHPTMDTVPRIVNLLPAYQPATEHPAFTGKGVVVGVMDIGFDLTHPNFYDDTSMSHYRIKAFWDQLAANDDPVRFPVGRDYVTTESILTKGCSTDGSTQFHGTHTSGTAIGGGYDSPYRGAAFGSDLCLVANAVTEDTIYIDKKDYYLFTSATDALGFKYLFDYAESQGKPCVVSFSEGYTPYMDEDDQLYSRFLKLLTGPGRILVASAGNEGSKLTYVDKPQGTEAAGAFIRVYRKNAGYSIYTDHSMTITLFAYDNERHISHTLSILSETCQPDQPLADTLFVGTDTCAIQLTCYHSAFGDDKKVYQLALTANRTINQLPKLALTVWGNESHVELYGNSSNLFANYDTDPRWNDATSGHNILAPGCFETPITVGSTTHRMSFTNVKGETIVNTNGDEPGRISYFSSTGPSRDGRINPVVTAPGYYIISSTSSYYLEAKPEGREWDVSYFDQGGRTYVWGADAGTSMSTPIVAGTIALWLEANPTLTRQDIIDILQRTCRHPEPDLTYPNNRYGYGEIDAYRGLLDVLGISSIKEVSQHQPQAVRIQAHDGLLHLTFSQLPSAPVTISVYATSGSLQCQTRLTVTQRDETVSLPILNSGIYAVQLTGDKTVTGSQLIRY